MRKYGAILATVLLLIAPLQYKEGALSYQQAEAFFGRIALGLVKAEVGIILKNWLKTVSKNEGKRVALAAVKALKELPKDADFRLAVMTALVGGSYGQAAMLTQQRAGKLAITGAKNQWKTDLKRLDEHPELFRNSFGQSAADTVEDQWNEQDDKLTCGAGNVDIEFKQVEGEAEAGRHKFTAIRTPDEELLTGRAMLQRLIFNRMMKNSNFQNSQKAAEAARVYSRLACFGGKSRKATAFMGGLAVNGKSHLSKFKDVREKSLHFMQKIHAWSERKL